MNNIKVLVFAVVSLFTYSCSSDDGVNTNLEHKESTQLGKLDIESFQKFINEPTDGAFSLVNSVSVSIQDIEGTATVSGGFNEEGSLRSATSSGFASIGGINVLTGPSTRSTSSENNEADDLFGTKIEFLIAKSGLRSSNAVVKDSMYIPTKIQLNSPVLVYDPSPTGDVIYSGQKLTWNADPKNDKGIVITVSYRTQYNTAEIVEKAQYDFDRVVTVVDNGECLVSANLFNDIPKGATVMVSLNRGNYKFASDEAVDEVYSLYSYSSVQYMAYYK